MLACRFLRLCAASAVVALSAAGLRAQPTPGAITGRVFNPATGEYLRNAEVRIAETGQSTTSEGEGAFRLAPVAPGRVTLEVSYTGFRKATAVVDVAAGATAVKNFDLVSTLENTTGADGTVKLQAFTVSTDREGSAKAIMDQRRNMNITNTVASDTFGDNAEGNIGEFLRNMPGVDLDLFYGEVRNVRLRGLSSEYTSVTVDGVSLASADANAGAAGNARAFTMEMASLNSMESIEVSKTISADVDANAPAGTINLRTKRAFDRAGRRWSWQTNVTAHSEEFSFNKTPGPNDSGKTEKIRPGGILEYSDVFLNKRLGVVLNISESNVYQETLISTLTYNRTPTAADPRPEVITALSFQWAPRFNKRFATTLTADYKVTDALAVSMGVVYNYADLWTPQRTVTFNTGARNTVQGDPYVNFTTTTGATIVANPVAVAKMGETTTLLPKFFYKKGNFDLEGKFAWSDATSWYDPLVHRQSVRDANSPTASNVNFRVTRSSPQAMDFQITQISGADIANGASFTSPAVSINDGRFSRSTLMSGEIVGTLKTTALLPVVWKAGVKDRYELRNFSDDQLTKRMDYLGGGATPISNGAWANYRSAYEYDYGISGGNISSISGGKIFMADLGGIAALYNANPSAFRQNLPAANYYTAYVGNKRLFSEEIKAAFLMGTVPLGRASFRAGLRFEDTGTDSLEPDPRTAAELRAAGFAVTNGRATTIPGLQYQFFSQPRVHRTGGFHNFFPSASFKERITQNLDFSLGYSTTIRRATYANLSGVWSVNDINRTVTAPNPDLKPETSKNLAARLAYYFEPVGQLGVTFFQNRVRNLHITQTISDAEFGNDDPDLVGYQFTTFTNSTASIRIRGMELEYSQALSFLPDPFKRLSVRGSYTRNYQELAPGTAAAVNLAPHQASAGLNYAFRRLSTNVNWTWSDDVPLSVTGLSYRRHRTNLDAGAGWRLTNHVSLNVSARNLLNSPYINMQWVAPSTPVWTRNETTGVSWTFAVKGTY